MYSQKDEEFFRSIAWCVDLLDQPGWTTRRWGSRVSKGEQGGWEDSYFGETLNTDRTIKALLSFYKKSSSPEPGVASVAEVKTLVSVGTGINGWPGVSHGGLIATVLDEAMGVLISLNYDSAAETGFPSRGLPIMTAGLNVNFKKPLPTPGEYLVTVWFKELKGRKITVGSEITDRHGKVLATGEALWIQLKEKL